MYTLLRHNIHGTNTNMQLYTILLYKLTAQTQIWNFTRTFDTILYGTNTHTQLITRTFDTTHDCGVHTQQGIPHYGTTILWRAVPFSMNVLLRGRWQWGGTQIGLSLKLTYLGHPQDFQYKTGHYWLQRNGILARFDYMDHLLFKAPRPFETSGITHTFNATVTLHWTLVLMKILPQT